MATQGENRGLPDHWFNSTTVCNTQTKTTWHSGCVPSSNWN